ncbi:pyruvate formate lyase family protein, partial [Cellulomonas sp.]|uniref:pyruvate formate lyase family protein n=1 Tax=Cellulomonas sp. TaxID=40001 RepID=UPI001B05E368
MSTTTAHSREDLASATPVAWKGFTPGPWADRIDVRDFIQRNYTPYEGDSAFLAGATARTTGVWEKLSAMFPAERAKGVYDVDQHTPSTITSHAPGYIDQANELIVGLQTDAPLKRAIMPNGGLKTVITSLKAFDYEPDPQMVEIFTKYRKTHNDGVFDAYTADVRRCRSSHVLTGLPDAWTGFANARKQ